jgi:hypothetical protein
VEGWLDLPIASQSKVAVRMRAKWVSAVALALLLAAAVPASLPAAAAIPTEPTASVSVSPSDTTVDASGVNPVDTVLAVNVTGDNIRPQPHTMWVNITFSTSTGWKVNPTKYNITWTLPANGGHMAQSIPVTVTVPAKVSANEVGTFTAAWSQENDVHFGTGQNATAAATIHIRQIFSTSASFANGTSDYTVKQGQDVAVGMRVSNFGNGDAQYDAELRNAADLLPNDVLLESTVAATVLQNGTGNVTAVIHANPYAIAGTYTLQLRVIATGAGTPPPAGAFADLTAQLLVTAAAPPPSNNNTTQPPPNNGGNNNNTTAPPPPPPPPDVIQSFLTFAKTPLGIGVDAGIALLVVALLMWRGSRKRAKKEREAAMQKARDDRKARMGGAPGPAGAAGAAGAKPALPARPQQRGAPARPAMPPRPQQRAPPGGPTQRPGAPPSK